LRVGSGALIRGAAEHPLSWLTARRVNWLVNRAGCVLA
jgi:hypothetical protein